MIKNIEAQIKICILIVKVLSRRAQNFRSCLLDGLLGQFGDIQRCWWRDVSATTDLSEPWLITVPDTLCIPIEHSVSFSTSVFFKKRWFVDTGQVIMMGVFSRSKINKKYTFIFSTSLRIIFTANFCRRSISSIFLRINPYFSYFSSVKMNTNIEKFDFYSVLWILQFNLCPFIVWKCVKKWSSYNWLFPENCRYFLI